VSIVVTGLPEIYVAAEKNDNEWNILFRRKRKKLFSGRKHTFSIPIKLYQSYRLSY